MPNQQSHHLWGGRFSASPDAQMKALNDSIGFDQRLYRADIEGSRAYAQALHRAGLLSAEDAQAIQDALAAILEEFESAQFTIQPGDEDIHTAVERRLIELTGPPGGNLHMGRSRNDQVATDIRLWLRTACDNLDAQLQAVQSALVQQATAHLETLMPGYTHLQPAQPITAAHWLLSFFWMLQRDRQRLAACRQRANVSPLGSSALAGTPYPIDRQALAESLGFDDVTPNSLDAVSDRDSLAELLFVAALAGVHLSRLAEDILLYSNPAFGFIQLPDAFSTGSSIMPQKRNADPMELARGKAGRLIGHLSGLLATLKGLPSGYNKDLQEDKEPLFDTYDTLMRLLPVVAGLVGALELDVEQMAAALDDGLLATELADWLVLEKGMPFRQAHHLVGQAVKVAEESGLALSQLPIGKYQAISPDFDEGLYAVLDFETAVHKRDCPGGTAPAAVRQQLLEARRLLGQLPDLEITPIRDDQRAWVRQLWVDEWGAEWMVSRGQRYHVDDQPGIIAWLDGQRVGLATYHIDGDACEVMSINSLLQGAGIGTALIQHLKAIATEAGCKRLWLVTTNDNTAALRFYQKQGFQLVAVHRGAVDEARRLKPEIPAMGYDGIPLRDEIELEMPLNAS